MWEWLNAEMRDGRSHRGAETQKRPRKHESTKRYLRESEFRVFRVFRGLLFNSFCVSVFSVASTPVNARP